jgi:hypothetical protein
MLKIMKAEKKESEMSERPTPETDANVEDIGMGCQISADFARKLRRCDEANSATISPAA